MTDAIINVRDLYRHFRRADGQAVIAPDRVTFSIPRGQFVWLLGPSGGRKSTLPGRTGVAQQERISANSARLIGGVRFERY